MKMHIGVDADTGLVHSMSTTAANAHDITEADYLCCTAGKTWCGATPDIKEFTSVRRIGSVKWTGRWRRTRSDWCCYWDCSNTLT